MVSNNKRSTRTHIALFPNLRYRKTEDQFVESNSNQESFEFHQTDGSRSPQRTKHSPQKSTTERKRTKQEVLSGIKPSPGFKDKNAQRTPGAERRTRKSYDDNYTYRFRRTPGADRPPKKSMTRYTVRTPPGFTSSSTVVRTPPGFDRLDRGPRRRLEYDEYGEDENEE